jgi:hypothetical protein
MVMVGVRCQRNELLASAERATKKHSKSVDWIVMTDGFS